MRAVAVIFAGAWLAGAGVAGAIWAQDNSHDGPLFGSDNDRPPKDASPDTSKIGSRPTTRNGAVMEPSETDSKSAPEKPPEEDDTPLKVNVSLVNVMASVRDKHNGLVPTLTKSDFEILEDGKPQEIKFFSKESNLPLTIGLLIDVSRSQENLIGIEQRAGSAFLDSVLKPKDEAFILSFGADTELLQDITSSKRMLQRGLEDLKPNFGFSGITAGPVPTATHQAGTVLYDAIYLAANEKLAREAGRKVLVVITDGDDEGSQVSIKKAIEAAQKANTTIYSIYYADTGFYFRNGYAFGGGGRGYLQQMSTETGGHVYDVSRRETLDKVFAELQDEMRTQYSIAYSSPDTKKDGSYHKLELKTKDHDLKVQARKGYYAMADY